MNDINLDQFKFDYDLTWAAVFLHHDGTVLGRYGSGPSDFDDLNATPGLRKTMERVLAAHGDFKRLRPLLEGKRGPKPTYELPQEIPSPMIQKALGKTGQRESCLHCHNIYDGQHEALLGKGLFDPFKVWKYPNPSNLGFIVDPIDGTLITDIQEDSPASRGGLVKGDVLERINDQPIYSLADVQFVLHFAKESDELVVDLQRSSTPMRKRLILEPGWRVSDLSWRGSLYGMPPRPGLWVERMLPGAKEQANIPSDKMALEVRGVFGNEVRKAGLKKGDIIIKSGISSQDIGSGEFHEDLRLNYHKPGSTLKLRVLRLTEEHDVEVTFQVPVEED